jgi:predicted S18 family serine protease
MKSKILVFLLIISMVGNAYFILFQQSQALNEGDIQEMQARINSLESKNDALEAKLLQNNQSLQSYASQMEYYREKVFDLESQTGTCPLGVEGFASLQAPAVFQKVETEQSGPFVRESVSENGTLINISVETQTGKGRVLVQTTPLMGVVFQDAANTAVFVAQQKTGVLLSGSDTIFSITAEDEIPGVDGPSAGALMTLLTISALNGSTLNQSITLTGTIDNEGHVGAIGGVLEKAKAAKEGGKTLFLLPKENSKLVTYNYVKKQYGGLTLLKRVPEVIDAKEYIEENVGIEVEYVDNIDDVLEYEK